MNHIVVVDNNKAFLRPDVPQCKITDDNSYLTLVPSSAMQAQAASLTAWLSALV